MSALLGLAFAAAIAAHADEVYRWVDESGRVHFGNVVPERFRQSASRIEARIPMPTETERREAETLAAQEKARAASAEHTPRPPSGPFAPAAPAGATRAAVPAAPKSSAAPGPDCRALFARYHESQACFAPFRLVGGGIHALAFEKCPVVPDPAPVCGIQR